MARGDVLEIVAFSVIFALAVSAAGEAGRPVLDWCESLRQVMFKFAGLIMTFAPFGVGAAIAVTVGHQGLVALLGLGKLLLTLYVSLIIFVVVIFGAVIWLVKIPLKPFVRAVWEPFTLAFATANSEAALPDAFAEMERGGEAGFGRRAAGSIRLFGWLDGGKYCQKRGDFVYISQGQGDEENRRTGKRDGRCGVREGQRKSGD